MSGISPATPLPVAVIIDISHSREHPDRAALQSEVADAFATVDELVEALQRIEPTIGDEFQAVYPGLIPALRATLLAQLFLPDGTECRFGLGEGQVQPIAAGRAGAIQDGPGWWSAREAVQQAREREYARLSFVRARFVSAREHNGDSQTTAALVNAYLMSRDQILSDMKPRARRILRGLLMNQTQAQIAESEGITQSSISQTLHNSGAIAVLVSEDELAGVLS